MLAPRLRSPVLRRYHHYPLYIPRRLPLRTEVSYPKAVTIALGCLTHDGILLCADTLYSDGYTKQYGSKIFTWQNDKISICIAIAGNATIAKMAAQDCISALHELNWDGKMFGTLYRTLRDVLKTVQHEYVDRVPVEERERSRFYLLIGIFTPASGHRLFASNDAALSPVLGFECIGVGRLLGAYIMEPSYYREMKVTEAATIALQALAAAKERVDGVGGTSQFVALQRGEISPILEFHAETMEREILEYRRDCAKLLLEMSDVNMPDEMFAKGLDEFTDLVRWHRSMFRGGEAPMKTMQEWLAKREAAKNTED